MPRPALAAAWLALGAVVVWTRVLPHLDAVTTSFPGYWLVAREVLSGTPAEQLYDDAWLAARMAAHGFPADRMLGPPPLALTAVPVAWLPYPAARAVWMLAVLTPALLGGVAWLARRLPPLQGLALGAAVLLGRPAAAGMEVAQVYPVLLVLHLAALEGWRRGRPRSGLALAPVVLLRGWHGLLQCLGWVVAGRWRGAAWAAAGFFGGALLTLPLLGWGGWRHLLLVQSAELADSPTAMATAYQTWRSLALHLTTLHPTYSPDPPLAGGGPWLWWIGAAALVASGLWAGRRLRPGTGAGFAMWTTLALLLAPYAEDHHMLLAAIPAFVLWEEAPRARAGVVAALVLLLPDWGFDRPTLLGGWRSLAAYPRVWGLLVLHAVALHLAAARRDC